MSLRTQTPHANTDRVLLSEQELIAIYMREVGPSPHGIYAASQVLDTLVDVLNCPEPEELQRGLNLIEYMGHEGLELEYDPFFLHALAQGANANANSKAEICDVASIETSGRLLKCGSHYDSDSDLDFDETGSLMECGDAMPAKTNYPCSPKPGGSTAKFNLYKLLDAIQSRHLDISCGFQSAHTRLESLREQNKRDSIFLRKLSISNELMGDRIHEMKVEVSGIFRDLELLKKPVVLEQRPQPVYSYKLPSPVAVNTEDTEGHVIGPNTEEQEEEEKEEKEEPRSECVIKLQVTKLEPDNITFAISANSKTRPSHIQLNVKPSAGVPVLLVALLVCWMALAWTLKNMMDGK